MTKRKTKARKVLEKPQIVGWKTSDALVEEIRTRPGARFVHAELRAERLILVLDADAPLVAAEQTRLASTVPRTEVLDRATWTALQRLTEAGLIGFTETRARILHQADAEGTVRSDGRDLAA